MKAREGRIMAKEASDQGSRGVGRVGNFECVYEWTRKLLSQLRANSNTQLLMDD